MKFVSKKTKKETSNAHRSWATTEDERIYVGCHWIQVFIINMIYASSSNVLLMLLTAPAVDEYVPYSFSAIVLRSSVLGQNNYPHPMGLFHH